MSKGLSETAAIRTLLLKHPREAWTGPDEVRSRWRALGYAAEPDFTRACEEYDAFAEILGRWAGEVRFLPADPGTGLDSIYVRDAACAGPRGLILGRMGKELRRGEPAALGDYCRRAGWPVAGEILAPGTLEGGDVAWLDARTVAVGHGYRTNAEGLRQLREILEPDGIDVVEAPLPHWDGPGDVLHLMSLLSPVGEGRLLVYSRLLPVPFRRRLLESGFDLIEVPDEEYAAMATNVLALAPGKCLALAGNPRTAAALEKAGLEVLTYEGREISAKGAGGPTCLTRPFR
ncbi:MAG TPA: arginine deiminase family protein [Candidatus Aminicenantes bacterium]|nr:arginine deiminase family protein [Candidatus Aminicenantes bacterium]HRY63728.1 arginine deiminase family protein [Candidatus Aminicenantes bacterium]HRZ70641.1 arginine deiminase family protein [Candidatus Aminicenantes bacterium]